MDVAARDVVERTLSPALDPVLDAPATAPGRRRPVLRGSAAYAGAAVVFALWLTSDLGAPWARPLVSSVVFVVMPTTAAIACWNAHRRTSAEHTGWAWLAAGCGTWATGSVAWAGYTLLLGGPVPFPSAADVGYIGYAGFIAVGVARFPRITGGFWSRWRSALDGVVIAASLLFTSLVWVLNPITQQAPLSSEHLVALAYPIVDVAVASLVLTRCLVLPREQRRVWVPLAGGLVVLAATDSLYIAASFDHDLFQPGGLVDFGWLLAFALVGIGALAAAPEDPVVAVDRLSDPPGMVQQLVPYVTIGLAAAAYLAAPATVGDDRSYLWLLAPFAALVAARQFVVVADHTAIARNLGDAVERRTSELRHREQWWQDLVQNLSDVVMVVGREGMVEYCSPSTGTGLGPWPSQVEHISDVWTRVHPDDRAAVRRSMSPVLDGRRRTGRPR